MATHWVIKNEEGSRERQDPNTPRKARGGRKDVGTKWDHGLHTSTTSFFRSFRPAFSSTFSFFSFRSCKAEGHLSALMVHSLESPSLFLQLCS